MKDYQVTLYCADGRFRPVSCIVPHKVVAGIEGDREKLVTTLKQEGIKKICQKRFWSGSDLKKYNYTKVKIRAVEK